MRQKGKETERTVSRHRVAQESGRTETGQTEAETEKGRWQWERRGRETETARPKQPSIQRESGPGPAQALAQASHPPNPQGIGSKISSYRCWVWKLKVGGAWCGAGYIAISGGK